MARETAAQPVLERDRRWRAALPLVVVLLTIGALAVREPADPDLWWHLATGRYILTEGRVPVRDVFSFTAGDRVWVTHEWLADLLLYAGYRATGWAGLVLLFALIVTAAFGLVYARCRSVPFVSAVSVLLAAVASAMTWGVRPQMFSLLFSSLFLYILLERKATKTVWFLPPLTLVWANLHSGFVAGLAITGVAAVGEEIEWLVRQRGARPWLAPRTRQLALVAVASLACGLVTPNGVSAALFPFGTLSNRLIQSHIEEWFSPDFHQPLAWPLAVYWLVLLGALAVSRRRVGATELLMLLGAGAAALYSLRHVPFLSLVGAPILARQLEDVRPSWLRAAEARPVSARRRRLMLAAMGVLAVAVGVRVYTVWQRSAQMEPELYPVAALEYMREHGLGGRIYNTYHWGGYLLWHGYSVFIDGRAELYGDEILGQYLEAHGVKPGWEGPLLRYGVGVALIESGSRLAVVMEESGRWRAVYRDKLASVFVPLERWRHDVGRQ